MAIITRFAPSPNGRLHLGHAYSALRVWQFASIRGGQALLRIEDIDTTRAREEYVRAIHDDLSWLGLDWPRPTRRQHEHVAEYCAALERLRAMGLLYPCRCTRRALRATVGNRDDWPRDPDGAALYPGTCRPASTRVARDAEAPCRHLGWRPGRDPLPPAWRLDMRRALRLAREKTGGPLAWREEGAGPAGEHGEITAHPEHWGDVILGRRDIGVSYHIAVVVDDAAQGITHVVRGQDLFHATAIHRLLQVLLDLPAPVYAHHALITDTQGRKLAKSRASTPLAELRARGVRPEEVRRMLGFS